MGPGDGVQDNQLHGVVQLMARVVDKLDVMDRTATSGNRIEVGVEVDRSHRSECTLLPPVLPCTFQSSHLPCSLLKTPTCILLSSFLRVIVPSPK